MSQPVTGSDYCKCFIAAAANDSQLTLLVTNPTEPFPSFDADHTYFYLTIVDAASYAVDAIPPAQREIVKVTAYVTSGSGYELTVERAITTTAQIWAVGAVCEIRPCEQWLEDLKGGGGFIQASYATVTDESGSLTNARQLVAGSNVTLTDSGAGGTLTIAANAGTGAPVDATYVTLSTNSTLTQERVLTAGTGISVTDAGANSTVTVANTAPMVQAEYVVISASGSLTSERVLTAGTGISITDGGANSTVTIAATSGGGTLRGVEFTTSDTWDVPADVSSIWLTMIAGGGAGASRNSTNAGAGGGSGEFCEGMAVAVTAGETLTITVGAGGTGGTAGANGSSGGQTSVATSTHTWYCTGGSAANGGAAGPGGGARGAGSSGAMGTQESNTYFGGGCGGAGGVAPGSGGTGAPAAGYPTGAAAGTPSGGVGSGGGGANSPWGVGGAGGNGNAAGSAAAATSYGAGGGGCGGTGTTPFNGGSGCGGYVLIQWIG